MTIYGGVGMQPQIAEAARRRRDRRRLPGPPAGPPRARAPSRLSQLEVLVLDEADRMLDMGFLPDVRRLLQHAAGEAADPAVLGHHARRDIAAAGARDPARPGDGAGRAELRRPPPSPTRSTRCAAAPQDRPAAGACWKTTDTELGAGLHPHQAPRQARGRAAAEGRLPRRLAAGQPVAEPPRRRRWTASATARTRSWWRPTSRRAAST